MSNSLLQGHKPIEAQDVPHEYNVTNLTNGFTVLTESQSFPGAVHMGKCITPLSHSFFIYYKIIRINGSNFVIK